MTSHDSPVGTVSGATLDLVVLDCRDARALADFYGGILGWAAEDADDDWVTLRPPSGGTGLAFQRIDSYVTPTWPDGPVPQQSHLDINVPNIDHAEPAVLSAGATGTGRPEPGANGFRVYLDPAGHPFCLVREG